MTLSTTMRDLLLSWLAGKKLLLSPVALNLSLTQFVVATPRFGLAVLLRRMFVAV